MDDDPFGFVMRMVIDTRYNTKAYVTELIENNIDDCAVSMDTLKDNVKRSLTSRRITYLNTMNPHLTVRSIYTDKHNINETHPITFTRFRILSHSLAIETGRWNRRAICQSMKGSMLVARYRQKSTSLWSVP